MLLTIDFVDNMFKFENPNDRTARLFFCQARKGVGAPTKPTAYNPRGRSSFGVSSDAESNRRASSSARP
jgi:hypothetical protein